MATMTTRADAVTKYTNEAALAGLLLAVATVLTSSAGLLLAAILAAALAAIGAVNSGVLRFSRVEVGLMLLTLAAAVSYTLGLVQGLAIAGVVYWCAGLLVFYSARILVQQIGSRSWTMTAYRTALLVVADLLAMTAVTARLQGNDALCVQGGAGLLLLLPVALLTGSTLLREMRGMRAAEQRDSPLSMLAFALASTLLMVVGIIAAGRLMMGVALVVALLLSPLLLRVRWAIGGLLALAFAASLCVANSGLGWAQASGSEDAMLLARMNTWHSASLVLQDAPLTGVGFGSFPLMLTTQYTPLYRWAEAPTHPYNFYLEMALDFGLPGALLLLYVITVICARGVDFVRIEGGQPQATLAAAILVGVTASLTYGIVSSAAYDTLPMLVLWLGLGFIAGLAQLGPARSVASKQPLGRRLAFLTAGLAVTLLAAIGLIYAAIPTPTVLGEAIGRNQSMRDYSQVVRLDNLPSQDSDWWTVQVAGFSGAAKAELATAQRDTLAATSSELASTRGSGGDAALSRGSPNAAAAQYRSSAAWQEILIGRADYLYAHGNYQAALGIAQLDVQVYGSRSDSEYERGHAAEQLGQRELALQAFTNAKTAPGLLSKERRSTLYRGVGDYYLYGPGKDATRALNEYRTGLGIHDTLELRLRAAEALLQLKRYAEAADTAKQAAASYADNAAAYAVLGHIYAKAGKCAAADAAYKQALTHGSKDANVNKYLANPTCK